MSLLNLAKRAKRINVELLALSVAQKNSGLIDERIKQQLTVGENEDAAPVGLYKSSRYAGFKKRIGSQAPSGIVDLKLSGSLYKGIKTVVKADSYSTDSSVSYSKYQIGRYSKKIYGLQKSNSKDIKFKNSVDTVKEYQKQLGL